RPRHFYRMDHQQHHVPSQLILRARMEVEALVAEKGLQEMPHEVGHPWRAKVALARERFEHALADWGATRARYWELKKAQWANSDATTALASAKDSVAEVAKHWKEKL